MIMMEGLACIGFFFFLMLPILLIRDLIRALKKRTARGRKAF